MSYLNSYRRKLTATGIRPHDEVVHSSKQTIKNNFSNSLFSGTVLINGEEHEAIITQEKKSQDKKMLLKPDSRIDIGSVVRIKDSDYLTMDFLGDGIHEVYPTATLKLCNSTFPIQTDKITVLMRDEDGNPILNDFGEEMYEEVGGETVYVPCVVSYTTHSDNTNEAINLPEGQIEVTIPFYESKEITDGKEFVMYGTKFKIIGIDYTKSINKVGILVIKGKKV